MTQTPDYPESPAERIEVIESFIYSVARGKNKDDTRDAVRDILFLLKHIRTLERENEKLRQDLKEADRLIDPRYG